MKDERVTTNMDAMTTIAEIERLERELSEMNAKAAADKASRDEQTTRLKNRSYRTSVIATVLFTLLIFVVFSAQTYAYFTDSVQSFNNSIQSGNLATSIITAGESADTTSYNFTPGTTITKEVKVDNTGSLPQYVRAKIDISIDKAGIDLDELKQLIGFNVSVIDAEHPDRNWYYKDGYYYYKHPLAPNDEPVLLYSTVIFSPNMGNEYTNAKITITVTTDAVQSDFNGADGAKPWDDSVLWNEN